MLLGLSLTLYVAELTPASAAGGAGKGISPKPGPASEPGLAAPLQSGLVTGTFELRDVLFQGGSGFTVLRCTSFALESCARPERRYSLADLLKYNFYLPFFFFGPIMTFDRFHAQVRRPHGLTERHLLFLTRAPVSDTHTHTAHVHPILGSLRRRCLFSRAQAGLCPSR